VGDSNPAKPVIFVGGPQELNVTGISIALAGRLNIPWMEPGLWDSFTAADLAIVARGLVVPWRFRLSERYIPATMKIWLGISSEPDPAAEAFLSPLSASTVVLEGRGCSIEELAETLGGIVEAVWRCEALTAK